VPALGFAALLVQFMSTCIPGNVEPARLKDLVRQDWRERSGFPPPPGSRGARVAYACDDFGLSYPLYGPGYDRGVVYVRERTFEEFLKHLDQEGVELLFVSRDLPATTLMVDEGVRRGRLKPLDSKLWSGYAVLPPR